jgi:S-adenosylmethionine-diacylglycerol 3-amino-3-carboxypropyl transferase
MRAPELKFAVVREDPDLEDVVLLRVTRGRTDPRALIVASGGCTALTLLGRRPGLALTAFDLNPAQLAHVQDKAAAVARGELRRLNVGDADPAGLNQRGEFEKLFRTLRAFLTEFVVPPDELARFFDPEQDSASRRARVETWAQSRYFPVAFSLAFHDHLLHAMFGPAATQHAEPGSYPGYFQDVFLRGLRREDAHRNYFLQHVLLGQYLPGCEPDYLRPRGVSPAPRPVERSLRLAVPLDSLRLVEGSLLDVLAVPELAAQDLYSLSNIFDWSEDALVAQWVEALKRAAPPGSAVLMRQLNNRRDLRRFFAPEFVFDDALGDELWRRDRSLFYGRIEVGFRRGAAA